MGKENNVDIKIIRFNNNVDKLQEKIDEIINNSDKFKKILLDKIWQENYSLNRFEKSYISMIK